LTFSQQSARPER
jgi:hypothetical protein